MLLDGARPGGGLVAVCTRNQTVNRLLEAVLADWQLCAREVTEAKVVLVERGLAAPAPAQVVWLTPMPLGDTPHLELPLSLTGLYHCLEQYFFPMPRRHIRQSMHLVADINLNNRWLTGQLLSLSDYGARVACPTCMPKGTVLLLDFTLDNRPLRINAEVIYEIPCGDAEEHRQPQAGVLFKPLSPALRQALRHYIESCCLRRACEQTGISPRDPALSWFEQVTDPWAALDR